MFSSIFGKRRSSPVEDEGPPIPGPKPEDGFVIVQNSPTSGLYPSVSGIPVPGMPYPQRPAPPAPLQRGNSDATFHYLEGVPFTLSRELQMATNKDSIATEIGDLLAFLTNKINIGNYEYSFTLERSVLSECST